MAGLDKVRGFDPVSGNPINVNKKVEGNENADMPAFTLEYGEGSGVVYEPSKPAKPAKTLEETEEEVAREEKAAALENVHTRFDGPGVEVSFSHEAVKASEAALETRNASEPATGIFDKIRERISRIREFFLSLWNGNGAEENAEDVGTASVPATEQSLVEDIIPKSDTDNKTTSLTNDPERIASFMVDYGGRHLAKNSDLLTQYDKKGNITSPNASDRRRILQGDGKTRKY